MQNVIRVGEAGVLRVMSELILRGHSPYKPAVDDHGVDLMLSTGIRIQVKTARLRGLKKVIPSNGTLSVSPRYQLTLGCSQKGANHAYVKRARKYSEECDYFIIWGIDENRFWIVPSFIMDDRKCLVLGPKPMPSPAQIRNMAAQGMGLTEISNSLGICEVTAWQHKRRDIEHGGFTRAVRSCEEKWEFLKQEPLKLTAEYRTRKQEIEMLEMMLEDVSQPSETIKH